MKKNLVLILSLVCLFGPRWAQALNLGEIRTEVRLHIKDSNTSRQNYSDTQVNNIINQVHRDVVNLTWVVKKSTSLELTDETTHYALPTDLIQIARLTFRDENMEEMSLAGLDGEFSDSDWETAGGYPDKYYQNPVLPGYVSFYPYPNSSTSTGTVKINYFAQSNTLSSDSNTPFNGDYRYQDYSDILIWGAVYEIYVIEGRVDKAQYYGNLYESRLMIMREGLAKIPNWWPSFSGQRK